MRSPPLPRVPVSSDPLGGRRRPASTRSRPSTARLQTASQSTPRAVSVTVIGDLCCQTVNGESHPGPPARASTCSTRGAGLDDWTGEQRRAAAARTGRRLVLLGAAGAGKTRALEARFRWLVDQGSRPERMAVLVPTANRARALTARLETSLSRASRAPRPHPGRNWRRRSCGEVRSRPVWQLAPLSAGDRLAMLAERVDELSVRHHDFGGRPTLLLGSSCGASTGSRPSSSTPTSTWPGRRAATGRRSRRGGRAGVRRDLRRHERMLAQAGARDEGDLVCDALSLTRARGGGAVTHTGFDHLLIDDAQELDLAAASLAQALCVPSVTIAGDPDAALLRYRGAGAQRLRSFVTPGTPTISLGASRRCPNPSDGLPERSWIPGTARPRTPTGSASPRVQARSSSGAVPTSAPRPNRSRSTSSA